jgi:hypothetical protein
VEREEFPALCLPFGWDVPSFVKCLNLMVPTAPAIANAINNALGICFNGLPLSAEKIFPALQEQRQKEE